MRKYRGRKWNAAGRETRRVLPHFLPIGFFENFDLARDGINNTRILVRPNCFISVYRCFSPLERYEVVTEQGDILTDRFDLRTCII